VEHYLQAISLDPEFLWASNNLAWLLATSPDTRVRDGEAAVRHATVACEKSEWRCWSFIDTLAAAYAEAGDVTRAVVVAEQALGVAPPENRPAVEARLRHLRAGQPIREV
jgi:hypothetical protein